VVGLTTDEDQDRWLATNEALYLLKPGDTAVTRFDERDGLHLNGNALHYCNGDQTPLDRPCTSGIEAFGQATSPGISVVAGGA
jgi:hypothetical protein